MQLIREIKHLYVNLLDESPLACLEAENISEDLYKAHRYRLGVSEGPSEHLPEKSLPLECNLVLLHGGK